MKTQETRCDWRTVHAYARAGMGSLSLYFPTRDNIRDLKVGDYAPSCLGAEREVTEIRHVGEDMDGRLFVTYSTRLYEGSQTTVSNSAKEDTLERSVRTSNVFHSAELDSIERNSRAMFQPATANR